MKRLIFLGLALMMVLGLSSVQANTTAPTIAEPGDYTTCMDYCMPEGHGFKYCHGECKGVATD